MLRSEEIYMVIKIGSFQIEFTIKNTRCKKCELFMPFAVENDDKKKLHHHCERCNAWQWGGLNKYNKLCFSCAYTRCQKEN